MRRRPWWHGVYQAAGYPTAAMVRRGRPLSVSLDTSAGYGVPWCIRPAAQCITGYLGRLWCAAVYQAAGYLTAAMVCPYLAHV
jgi:hypothetical protein